MPAAKTNLLAVVIFFSGLLAGNAAENGRKELSGNVPPAVARLAAKGRLNTTNRLALAIGLPLRDAAGLDEFLRQLYDPASTNFHKFITPPEFAARFGPTEQDYEAVKNFARTNGLAVAATYSNRLVLDVAGSVAKIENAFHVTFHTYRHPTEARDFFAPDAEPSVPANLKILSVEGLSDFSLPRRAAKKMNAATKSPMSFNGTGPGHEYAGSDFRNAYVPGCPLNGAGQTVALLEYSDYFQVDITNYENIVGAVIGVTNYVSLNNVLVSGSTPNTSANDEVALDIEMAVSMAPMLSQVIVYEKSSVSSSLMNRIASDNLAKQASSSWTVGNWSASTATTYDNILKNMAAQGQSFFQCSADNDAYTGSQPLDSGTTIPVDSPYAIVVGGTTLTMSGSGSAWSSETVWNYNLNGISNEGSGGGISAYYAEPYWQTNVSMAANSGSTNFRNVPDVALTADDLFVSYDNGDVSGTNYFMGTSASTPLWAGFCALANQLSVATNGTTLGFLNPTLYNIANSSAYAASFHDTTNGNNVGSHTAGLFNAVPGYDLATGLGTPTGTNLINALIWPPPNFTNQPAGKNVTNGTSVTFTAAASSTTQVNYFWLFNGTNLPAGGNVSGVTTNALAITAATTNNAGSYQLVATNATGFVTSSVAVLNVGFVPTISVSPASLTLLAGSNAVFTATPGGSSPFGYQWQKNGTNFAGSGITGTNSSVLTLASVVTNSTANYTVIVTNLFGAATSSIASLTVVLPPSITSSSLTNRTIQCGSNTNIFTITAAGTAPLGFQWFTNGTPVIGAATTSFALTNLHFATITNVAVVITNAYASITSNAVLTVQDTLAPAITLNGAAVLTNELGSTFTDPGATAGDLCAGTVPVTTNGTVNVNLVGTNVLTYLATDGNGNTNTATRTVIIRDTTPPVISWSFTNLFLAANSNCIALMTNVTGTNFILATDLSGSVTNSQSPTNNAPLPVGTNIVVITVADASGNKSFSTNRVIVYDVTPPQILAPPQNQTNTIGGSANFSVAATACTPLTFQWLFNNGVLTAKTNSTLTLSNLVVANAGNYTVVLNSSGGAATSAVATLTVNLLSTSVTLASSENPSGFKDNLNFIAAAPTNATGAIQFFMNGTAFDLEPLTNGSAASTNLSNLPRGTNLIAAVYSGNAAYLPATNFLSQIVTNHPPQVVPAFYTLVAGLNLSIPVASLATNWSDADGDAPFIASIGTSTNGVTITNATPLLFYSDPNDVNDQFVCSISDGFGGTNLQAVNIVIVPQTNATPNISGVALSPAGGIVLQLDGGYGSTYVLEGRTNLAAGNWQPVATNTPGITGVWSFTDFGVTNNPSRFYRLKLLP